MPLRRDRPHPAAICRRGFGFFATALLGAALVAAAPSRADAAALLLVEADTGRVLHADRAGHPWYPASVTKLMTAYVILKAVKEKRITTDSLFTVSERAAAQQPSKMGFKPGTTVTVDNALKMLMVKSANDMAVVLAEGLSGSVEGFSDEMNAASRRLGMSQSSWVNPNGLPAEAQVTSARDMALLTRAIYRELPEYEFYWRIPAIKFGRKVMRNYNALIDRYPGADGMKTGFICASGFNLVASATRNGHRLIAVVMGASSGRERGEMAARLLEKGFNGGGLSWLMPSLGTIESVPTVYAEPPNLREDVCGKNRKRPGSESEDDGAVGEGSSALSALLPQFNGGLPAKQESLLGPLVSSQPPVVVFTGAGKKSIEVAKREAEKAGTKTVAAAQGASVFGLASAGAAAFSWPEPERPNKVNAASARVPMPPRRPKR